MEHPVYGIGGGGCQYMLSLKMLRNQDMLRKMGNTTEHAHSDLLEYVVDFGLIGLFVIVTCFISWIWCFWKSKPTKESLILLIGIFISFFHSCFDMNLHITSTMIAFVIIVSASLSMGKCKGDI